MTRLFCEEHVPDDPMLGPLFANMSPDHPQRVATWLGEVFGGPDSYSEAYGGNARMVSQHLGKSLTEASRVRWVSLLLQSATEAGLPSDPEFAAAFQSYVEWGSRLAVEDSQADATSKQHMPMPQWSWSSDAGPPDRRALAPVPASSLKEPPVLLPEANEPVGFERHIGPMFRRHDRQSMKFLFDLGVCGDVRQHADAILERLRDGSMPCDGAWPQEQIDVFERWVNSGKAP